MVSLESDTPLSQMSMASFGNGDTNELFGQYSNVGGTSDMTGLNGSCLGGLSLNMTATDVHTLQSDNRLCQIRIQDLQMALVSEQETVSALRKKLNNSERERLEKMTNNNDEVSELNAEVLRLRSQLEKGEAVRQHLEFDVEKLKRGRSEEKRSLAEKETLLNASNSKLKNTLSDLNRKLSQLQQEMKQHKDQSRQEIQRLLEASQEKDQLLSVSRSERDSLESEKARLTAVVTQQEKTIETMNDKIREFELTHRSDVDTLKQHVLQHSHLQDQENRIVKELQNSNDKLKVLESAMEAERASHLESKFNAEIIQLRMKELESAVESERGMKNDSLMATAKLQEQLRELQNAYDRELKSSQESREKLEQDLIFKCVLPATRAEKEYALLSKQLQIELEDKKSVISQLSRQLELHQNNFQDLKDELNNTKKKQLILEGTYEGSMKELDMLIQGFMIDQPTGNTKKKTNKKASGLPVPVKPANKLDGDSNVPNPSTLLDTLRKILTSYRNKLQETNKELLSVKVLYEKTSTELQKLKDSITKKDKALENTQLCATRSSKDIKRLKAEALSLAQQLEEVKVQMETTSKALQEERLQHNHVNHQTIQLASKCAADEKAHTELLHSLYRQLVTGLQTIPTVDDQLSSFSTTELGILITEQLSLLTNTAHRAEEKIKLLEGLVKTRDESYEQLQRLHEDQLQKLSAATQGQNQSWQQQKQQLEQHYSQLLADIHSRHKKTQSLADQAWEKVRASGTLQQGLEEECLAQRKQVQNLGSENSSLLSACALLCGALYPSFGRLNALSAQRQLLGEKLISAELFRSQVQLLLQALSVHPQKSTQEVDDLRRRRAPLLVFRGGAIAILAANRLLHCSRYKSTMFLSQAAGIHNAIVCCGGVTKERSPFAGAATLVSDGMANISKQDCVGWLRSSKLSNAMCSIMSELNTSILSSAENSNNNSVISSARNSFDKLLSLLPSEFIDLEVSGHHAGFYERGSLVWGLHRGLLRALEHPSSSGRNIPLSSQDVLNGLQKSIMEFTQHLHTTEVERRDLRQEVSRLKKAKQSSIGHLKQECKALKNQTEDMISRNKYGDVCTELEEALKREEQAQRLLQEQNERIKELSDEIDTHQTCNKDKEKTLADAVTGLNAARKELQYQEQQVRQLGRQREQLEREKNSIQDKVKDAEHALRTAARDRETLSTFMDTVSNSLEKVQTQWSVVMSRGPVDFSALLSPEALSTISQGRKPSDLAACQNLVQKFVSTHQMLNGRLQDLQAEISQHKRHIQQLKTELSDACHRQSLQEYDPNLKLCENVEELEITQEPIPDQHHIDDEFRPLVVDTTESSVSPTKSKIINNDKLQFKTPTRSSKMGKARQLYDT